MSITVFGHSVCCPVRAPSAACSFRDSGPVSDSRPDDWETANGLDPSDPEDRNGTNLSAGGYTNVERYLNELAGDFS